MLFCKVSLQKVHTGLVVTIHTKKKFVFLKKFCISFVFNTNFIVKKFPFENPHILKTGERTLQYSAVLYEAYICIGLLPISPHKLQNIFILTKYKT